MRCPSLWRRGDLLPVDLMAGRLRHGPLCVAACFAVAFAWVIAGQRVEAIPQVPAGGATRVTVKETEKAIDKAAAERQIHLSEAAKTVPAVEVVRQSTAKGADEPAESRPDVKIQEVLASVTDRSTIGEITADQAAVMVSTAKVRQITPGIKRQVKGHRCLGKDVEPGRARACGDESRGPDEGPGGFGPIGGSDQATERSVPVGVEQALAGRCHHHRWDVPRGAPYAFTHFVKLTIETIPAGATVRMEGKDIGVTSIPSRLVEPGKLYRFEFALAGYRSPPREFYVTPAPDAQTISEALAPDAQEPAAGVAPGGSSGPRRPCRRKAS